MRVRRFAPSNVRAAVWALRSARRTRRLLISDGLEAALDPAPPPSLPDAAQRGVRAALRRLGESCLVEAIVMQAWEAAHGRERDLVIGVTAAAEFRAHAWLEGDDSHSTCGGIDSGELQGRSLRLAATRRLGGGPGGDDSREESAPSDSQRAAGYGRRLRRKGSFPSHQQGEVESFREIYRRAIPPRAANRGR